LGRDFFFPLGKCIKMDGSMIMEHFPHSFRWMGYGEMDWLGCMTGNGYGFMDGASIFSFSFAHKNEFPTSFMHLGLRWRLYLRTLWGWRAWGTTQGCAGLSLEGITAVKRLLSNGNANDFSRLTLELLYLCSSCDMIFTFSCFQGDGILNI
jgi:hypothetical protein